MNIDARLDAIYELIDTYLCAHEYSFVDRILLAVYDTVKVGGLSLDEVLGFLTATLGARKNLSFRNDLLLAAKNRWGADVFIGL